MEPIVEGVAGSADALRQVMTQFSSGVTVVTAVRHGVTVAEAGTRLHPNGERHLRERARLARLYPPGLLAETVRIAALSRSTGLSFRR